MFHVCELDTKVAFAVMELKFQNWSLMVAQKICTGKWNERQGTSKYIYYTLYTKLHDHILDIV